ncbi:MAG: DedA family protein [Minisyncoccota bacterium]
MIHSIIDILTQYAVPLGWFGVFIAEVIEEIVVPIPSSIILLGAGFIFLKGTFTLNLLWTLLFTIAIPAATGLTLGSFVIYILAYKGGKLFLDKYGNWVGIRWSDIESMNERFNSGNLDELSIIIARVFPIIPSVLIAVFCGLIRMPYKKYIYLTFVGAFFKALLLAIVGWQVGRFYIKYASIISRVENTVLIIIILGVVSFILYRKRKLKVL